MRLPTTLAIGLLYGITPLAAGETDRMLAKVDPRRIAQCEAALRAELNPRITERVGPIVLTEERFTNKLADGSVQVSQYWGRAPMQAYPFFEAYELLGDKKYLRAALDLADYYLRIQKPEGFWQYLPDGTPCFSLGGQVYRHDQPEKWPKEFPQKHDGIQKFTRDNGGPGDAPHFLAAWRQGGREALRAKFSGSVKLSPEEYERTRLSAAKWVASQRDAPRSPAQFLLKLRTAQGRFMPEQLAPAAPPHFCGQGLHSFTAANWFDIPWRQ